VPFSSPGRLFICSILSVLRFMRLEKLDYLKKNDVCELSTLSCAADSCNIQTSECMSFNANVLHCMR